MPLSIHTLEYYSGIKRNKILIHATIQINLESMLKEARHKGPILYDSIYMEHEKWQIHRVQNRLVIAKDSGKGE